MAKLETEINQPNFWSDQEAARKMSKVYEDLKSEINAWQKLQQEAQELIELSNLSDIDEQLEQEVAAKLEKLRQDFSQLEFSILFSGKYDQEEAILSIHAGTGGVDAQDWAEILLRMYLRFCEKHNFTTKIIEQNRGSEAGIKSVTVEILGRYAYGWLKSENGVHRLIRISPFDAESMRHTSFALVEVLPSIETTEVISLAEDDLKIEVMRASGHGGQSVNTTDSAVRITHLPTGISVKCQNERSQLQNKQQAMKILRAKLLKYYQEQEDQELQQIKGQYQQAEWGNQARSYVMQPYQLVKDHRTNHETSQIDKVLDGEIDEFISHYLRSWARD